MAAESESPLSAAECLAILRRRAGVFLWGSAIVTLIGVALAFRLPPIYESEGVLLVEQPEVPEYVVRSTVPSYPEERVRIITQRVLTAGNLGRIIEKHGVYPELAASPDERLREFRDHLTLGSEEPALLENLLGANRAAAALALSIAFAHPERAMARDVARDLVTLYLEENQLARREQAIATAQFLTEESESLNDRIAELEQQLAEFKRENADALPELAGTNREMVDRTERDLDAVEREIRSLRERQSLYSAELAELSPYAAVVDEEGLTVLGPEDRLKVLQRRYLQLSATYSDNHPDVISARREIESLSAATGLAPFDRQALAAELALREDELADARDSYSPDHPDVQQLERAVDRLRSTLAESQNAAPAAARSLNPPPDNPVYLERQVQLEAVSAELDATLARRDQLRARLRELESKLIASPEVERQYNALNRRYDQLLSQHDEVQATLRDAETAVNLESSSRGERFTVLSTPSLPSAPVSPNRPAVLMLTLVLAVGVGALLAAVREKGDDTLRNARSVTELLDIPPLVAIPRIENRDDVRRRRFRYLAGATAAGLWAALVAMFAMTPAG